jgi:hypothetical protein
MNPFVRDEKKYIGLDAYEEGAIIRALNEMRTKELAEGKPTDVENELILKIIHAPSRKASILGSLRSPAGTSRGEEEQRSEADTRRQAGVAERSLRRRDEAR